MQQQKQLNEEPSNPVKQTLSEKSATDMSGVPHCLTNEELVLEPEAKRKRVENTNDSADQERTDICSEVSQSDKICTNTTIKVHRDGFDENKWFPDENCDSCRKKFIDPGPKDLVMFLHALKYKVSDNMYIDNPYMFVWKYSWPRLGEGWYV